jgi:hypothetical protein
VRVNPYLTSDGGGIVTPDGEEHQFILVNPDNHADITVVTLTGVAARAFGQLHETGHRAKRFGKTDKDATPQTRLNGYMNNYKIWNSCFFVELQA